MVAKFLVVDDLGARTDAVRAAALPIPEVITIESVGSLDALVGDYADRLAEFDVIAVDAHMSSDRATSPGGIDTFPDPARALSDDEVPMSELEITTGIGAMLWLEQMMGEPEYRQARVAMHGPHKGNRNAYIYSFMDFTEPHSRLFAPAAYLWFEAELFPATATRDLMTKHLKRIAVLSPSDAMGRHPNNEVVKTASRHLETLLGSEVHKAPAGITLSLADWMQLVKEARVSLGALKRAAKSHHGVNVPWQRPAQYSELREELAHKTERYLSHFALGSHEWVAKSPSASLLQMLDHDQTFWSAEDVKRTMQIKLHDRRTKDP